MYVGQKYYPRDNSYCIEIESKKAACISQEKYDEEMLKRKEKYENYAKEHSDMEFPMFKKEDIEYSGPNLNEVEAEFIIIKEPYKETFEYFGNPITYDFVQVKSSKTGKVYRCLWENKWLEPYKYPTFKMEDFI